MIDGLPVGLITLCLSTAPFICGSQSASETLMNGRLQSRGDVPAPIPKDVDGSAPMGTAPAGDQTKRQLKAAFACYKLVTNENCSHLMKNPPLLV